MASLRKYDGCVLIRFTLRYLKQLYISIFQAKQCSFLTINMLRYRQRQDEYVLILEIY